jgi:hypothetical protein
MSVPGVRLSSGCRPTRQVLQPDSTGVLWRSRRFDDAKRLRGLRLRTNSNLVGCSTRRSDGFAPSERTSLTATIASRIPIARRRGAVLSERKQGERPRPTKITD